MIRYQTIVEEQEKFTAAKRRWHEEKDKFLQLLVKSKEKVIVLDEEDWKYYEVEKLHDMKDTRYGLDIQDVWVRWFWSDELRNIFVSESELVRIHVEKLHWDIMEITVQELEKNKMDEIKEMIQGYKDTKRSLLTTIKKSYASRT